MEIVFATHNLHKTEEARAILGPAYHLLNLPELGCPDIPETADTLKGNALQKAQYVVEHYRRNCFADDTGLEVEALDGRPGVYSARYAGSECCEKEDYVARVFEVRPETDYRKGAQCTDTDRNAVADRMYYHCRYDR